MTVLDVTPLLSSEPSDCEDQKRTLLQDPMELEDQKASPIQSDIEQKKKKEISPTKKQKGPPKQPTGAPRGRRKSRWKLKFHHQALPPEYLKHYRQQEKKRRMDESNTKIVEQPQKLKVKKTVKKSRVPSIGENFIPVETVLQTDPAELQQLPLELEQCKDEQDPMWSAPDFIGQSFPHLNIDLSQNKAFIENLLSNQIEINRVDRPEPPPPQVRKHHKTKKPKAIPSSGRIMNYSDLPYMGEITLDGIKPRRGRKPKKADICHLIYKNYGQIFPGAPNSVTEEPTKQPPRVPPVSTTQRARFEAESPLPTVSGLINHTEVQNRIINSLLERRLTQENRDRLAAPSKSGLVDEPLNLCLKDLQSLKIKLSRKHGNIYETKAHESPPPTKLETEVKKEVINVDSEEDEIDDSDLTPFNLVTTELRDSSDEDSCVSLGSNVTLTKVPESTSPPLTGPLSPLMPSPDSMSYWPNNYFYPPMPLLPEMYYQRLNALKQQQQQQTLAEKKIKNKNKIQSRKLAQKSNPDPRQAIAKRKRSAIFIPPVPPENTSNNPATEVSICKFKFTGGAKPSLQEKKMLSVDSGGNFRYYSGTGDKSMRGYEYFPRESLQQCQENTGCSPSGVFLTASALGSGEKIPEDVGHSGFFDPTFPLQVAKTEPKVKQKRKRLAALSSIGGDSIADSLDGEEDDDDDDSEHSGGTLSPTPEDIARGIGEDGRRVRKSRKSLAREKLEQTFKEKGFLIQTQQLESAEGATYCKFRQLRKFTRYLFRSWKDYLPGNVRDLSLEGGLPPTVEVPASPQMVMDKSP